MSMETAKDRRPYDKFETTRKRTVNFWASTNPKAILRDTENTRFLVFEITAINWNYSKTIDIHKVWAQAFHLYDNNFDYQLTKKEADDQAEINENFGVVKVEEDLIAQYLKLPSGDVKGTFYTASTICDLFNQSFPKLRLTPQGMGVAIKKVFGVDRRSHKRKDGTSVKGYFLVLHNFPFPKRD
jgi:hypothetical protein